MDVPLFEWFPFASPFYLLGVYLLLPCVICICTILFFFWLFSAAGDLCVRCYMWGAGPFCQHLMRQFYSIINILLGFLVEMVEINKGWVRTTHFVPTPLLGFEAPTQPPGPTLATLIGPEGLNPPSYTSYNPLVPLAPPPTHTHTV